MTVQVSKHAHWQAMLKQQALMNAERWLSLAANADHKKEMVHNEYDNLLRALEFTLRSPETFDLSFKLIEAFSANAFSYADWDRWQVYLQQAIAYSQQLGQTAAEAQISNLLGDIYYAQGQIPEAQQAYMQAKDLFETLDMLPQYANLLAKLAHCYVAQDDISASIRLCQQSLALAESIGDQWAMAQAYIHLSAMCEKTKNWEYGVETAEKALQLYRILGDEGNANRALVNKYHYLAQLGEWERVQKESEKLVQNLTASGEIYALAVFKNNLAVTAYQQDKLTAAEANWIEASHLFSQIKSPKELALTYNNLGYLYNHLQEYDSAKEMLGKAITLFESLNNIHYWANSIDNLAMVYEAEGNTAVVINLLETAIPKLQSGDLPAYSQKLLDGMEQRLSRHKSL